MPAPANNLCVFNVWFIVYSVYAWFIVYSVNGLYSFFVQ